MLHRIHTFCSSEVSSRAPNITYEPYLLNPGRLHTSHRVPQSRGSSIRSSPAAHACAMHAHHKVRCMQGVHVRLGLASPATHLTSRSCKTAAFSQTTLVTCDLPSMAIRSSCDEKTRSPQMFGLSTRVSVFFDVEAQSRQYVNSTHMFRQSALCALNTMKTSFDHLSQTSLNNQPLHICSLTNRPAMPMPVPMHMVVSRILALRRLHSLRPVTIWRAPVQPRGWPCPKH